MKVVSFLATLVLVLPVVVAGQVSTPDTARSVLEVPADANPRAEYYKSVEFREIYRQFVMGVRSEFSDKDFELLTKLAPDDPEFHEQVTDIVERTSERILLNLASSEKRSAFSFNLSKLASLSIAMGDLKRGTMLFERSSALNSLFHKDQLGQNCLRGFVDATRAFSASPISTETSEEERKSLVTTLARAAGFINPTNEKELGAHYSAAIACANLLEWEEAIKVVNFSISGIEEKIKEIEETEEAETDESAEPVADSGSGKKTEGIENIKPDEGVEKNGELIVGLRRRLMFLKNFRKNLYLAIGDKSKAADDLVSFIELYRENRAQAWEEKKANLTEGNLPRFHPIWNACVETGLGARQFGIAHSSNKTEAIPVRFIFEKTGRLVHLIPVDNLPQEGAKLVKELRSTIYLRSNKVEKALKEFLEDPRFEDLKTVQILQFPLLEYEIANGKGEKAWERFLRLQDNWKELSESVEFEEDFKSLSDLFFVENFNFSVYRNYLCTYFDNEEFREFARFKARWKNHNIAFGFQRKIPEHTRDYLKDLLKTLREKREQDLAEKNRDSRKPTPASKDK